ncbi:MAG TPA: TonB-dependent receptor, partial [Terriglobales bacterium]|nr:TonB-dependent receptor [Terriglobales bacterium]
ANCAGAGFFPNTTDNGFQAGLVPVDLTRGGRPLDFHDTGNINEYAVYVMDTINWGHFTLSPGLRVTRYDGLSQATGVQPRMGLSYLVKRTGTVLRLSYARTLETPHNENLLLSSATGVGGLSNVFGGSQVPLPAGRRNQFNVGFQQAIGRFLIVDADYFWKFTHNAAEFDVLLTTPITFPIMWRKDKLDGLGVRVSTTNLAGFRLNTTMSTGRLRYFPPEVGGLIFNTAIGGTPFRTDSDDKFYQTTNLQYQWHKKGPWAALTWRYDNGEVAGGSTSDLQGVLGLTADQQAQMGFFCGSDFATPTHRISSCNLPFPQFGATRVVIPAPGTADDDRNPPRVAPRTLFDLGIGTDDLLMRGDRKRVTLQFTVVNLTNKQAMYNFLSTFGGTHFVQPRSYQAKVGFVF